MDLRNDEEEDVMKTLMVVVAISCCLIAGCGDGSEEFVKAQKFLPRAECRECNSSLRIAPHIRVSNLTKSQCRGIGA